MHKHKHTQSSRLLASCNQLPPPSLVLGGKLNPQSTSHLNIPSENYSPTQTSHVRTGASGVLTSTASKSNITRAYATIVANLKEREGRGEVGREGGGGGGREEGGGEVGREGGGGERGGREGEVGREGGGGERGGRWREGERGGRREVGREGGGGERGGGERGGRGGGRGGGGGEGSIIHK